MNNANLLVRGCKTWYITGGLICNATPLWPYRPLLPGGLYFSPIVPSLFTFDSSVSSIAIDPLLKLNNGKLSHVTEMKRSHCTTIERIFYDSSVRIWLEFSDFGEQVVFERNYRDKAQGLEEAVNKDESAKETAQNYKNSLPHISGFWFRKTMLKMNVFG